MTVREAISECYNDDELQFLPGLDDYLIGTVERFGQEDAPCYDLNRLKADGKIWDYSLKAWYLDDVLGTGKTIEEQLQGAALEGLRFLTGYETTIVGLAHRYDIPRIICHDKELVFLQLESEGAYDDKDPREGAYEWYSYNIIGSWVGDRTPCFLNDFREAPDGY